MDNILTEITIYHNNNGAWVRYNVDNVSFRNTSIRNRNTLGISNVDNALIRIFEIDRYNRDYFISKGDVIVKGNVNDEIVSAPLTEMRKKYGEENCYQVISIDIYKFDDDSLKEINHIKVGAK